MDWEVLGTCVLFDGIRPEDQRAMLGCLGASVKQAAKNQFIFREGDPAHYVGVLLEGSAQVIREDYYGNRSILAGVGPGGMMGESFAYAGVQKLPVSVVAMEDSLVLVIDSRRITATCANACGFHNQLIFNMLKVVARQNLILNQKIEVTSKRTTREKLMTYLLAQAKQAGSHTFTIPYDRQALADYLEVERSAMSAEISKLRKEGILDTNRSTFRLLKQEEYET